MKRSVIVLVPLLVAVAGCGGGGGGGAGEAVRGAEVGSVAEATEILTGSPVDGPAAAVDKQLEAARAAAAERISSRAEPPARTPPPPRP